MNDDRFKAIVVSKNEDRTFRREVVLRDVEELPNNDVLIRVHYSSLNYKDALSATGHRGVTRKYPHTPGIDAAGIVVSDRSDTFLPGDEVVVIGYDLGMDTPGGFGQYIRIPAGWIVPLPSGLTLRESMIYGTAGFTAAMAVNRLIQHGIAAGKGEILVTGATGGLGIMTIALLSRLGFEAVAATGKKDKQLFLHEAGAGRVISREEAIEGHEQPLMSRRWQAVVDAVGGSMLDAALKSTSDGGAVAACGNVASGNLNTTVYPFILRGIALYGIDSAHFSLEERKQLWTKLAGTWKIPSMNKLVTDKSLEELDPEIDRILEGQQIGRIVVNLDR